MSLWSHCFVLGRFHCMNINPFLALWCRFSFHQKSVSKRSLASQPCSFGDVYSTEECTKSVNKFRQDVIWCHKGSTLPTTSHDLRAGEGLNQKPSSKQKAISIFLLLFFSVTFSSCFWLPKGILQICFSSLQSPLLKQDGNKQGPRLLGITLFLLLLLTSALFAHDFCLKHQPD